MRIVGTAPVGPNDIATKGYVDAQKFVAVIGDGVAATYTVTHTRNSQAVNVSIMSNEATAPTVSSVSATDASTVTIVFNRAPLALSVSVTVI